MSSVDFSPHELIAPTTDAVATHVTFPIEQRFLPASIFATGLAGVEEVDLFFSVDNGVTFLAAQQDGSPVTLSLTNNEQSIVAPIFLGITKDATVSAAGVYLFTNKQAKQQ